MTALEWLEEIARDGFIMPVSLRDGGEGDLDPRDITIALAEARAAALAEAAERVRALHASGLLVPDGQGPRVGVSLPAVLAILEPKPCGYFDDMDGIAVADEASDAGSRR